MLHWLYARLSMLAYLVARRIYDSWHLLYADGLGCCAARLRLLSLLSGCPALALDAGQACRPSCEVVVLRGGGGSSLLQRMLSSHAETLRYIALFSCHDFRVEPGVFAPSRQALYYFILSLRERFPGGSLAVHISDKRLLGVGVLVAVLEEPGLGRRLLEAWQEVTGPGGIEVLGRFFPLPGYISSLVVTLEGRVYIVYNLPLRGGVREEILRGVEGLVERYGGGFSAGFTVPVRNCTGSLGFEEWRVEEYRRSYRAAVASAPQPTAGPRLLDMIIVAALDWDPWLSLQELESLVHIFEARLLGHSRFLGVPLPEGLRLRRRRLGSHYRRLSASGAVGRVRLRGLLEPSVQTVFEAPRECGEAVYAAAAGTMGTSSVAVLEDRVVAGMSVPGEFRVQVLRALEGCRGLRASATAAGLYMPFPFEYYDPAAGEWRREPVDVVRNLYRFELVEDQLPGRRQAGRGGGGGGVGGGG